MLTERDAGGVAFSERPVAALVAGHGKIIVVGTESRTAGLEAPAPPRIALLRYRSDGSLDHSFGEGRLVTDFAGTAVAAVRQPNAKIVVLGSNLRGALVARYRPNGSLDRTFGHRGVVEITRRLFTSPRQLLLQTHGRIVLSSSEGLARLKRTGAIDRSFGHRGFEKVIAGGAEDLTQLLRAGRGRLLLTGRSGARLALLRFRTNGTPDRSFGARGLRVPHGVTFPGQPAAVEPDGKIILSGEESRHVVLTRLDRNGSRDPTFGHNGRVVVPMRGFVRRIVQIGGHRLLVAGGGPGEVGGSSTRWGFMLARLHR